MDQVKAGLNLHPVQIIGMESIDLQLTCTMYVYSHVLQFDCIPNLSPHLSPHSSLPPPPLPLSLSGKEGIAAGMFLPQMPCLLHGKVTPTHLDLWVRTPSSLLTDSLVKLVEQVFK